MKTSLEWMQYYSNVPLLSGSVDNLIDKIGAQLGAVDSVESLAEKYKGAVIAKVVSCQKHPNADKLSVCRINDGGTVKKAKRDSQGRVQVVCGAPNVAAGQTVVWLPPGATVPSTFDNEPFVLEAKELRGVISNGMIASAKELAFGEDHNGILVIDEKIRHGTSLIKAFGLDDYIIEIENKMFTHRPDCFGMLGIAREIAGISGKPFKSPAWYKEEQKLPAGNGQAVRLKNELPHLVPRFCALAVSGVKVGPSPAWMQTYLARVGVRPINNIVDITNYYMLLTAQPLHVYDADKLATNTLGVRLSKTGEKLKLIGGKEINLQSGAIVITDGLKPIGLGGVMGGADTEVSEDTKNIVLECATFDMNITRKTAMAYGLFTDAATRFTKNQSPRQNLAVIAKAADEVRRIAGGHIGRLSDDRHQPKSSGPIHVPASFINERLGLALGPIEMKRLLDNVEFKVRRDAGKLAVTPPFWRTDIEIPEDIVEEIGRLYGYDHLNPELPRRDIKPTMVNAELFFKSRLRDILVRAGANELVSYSFMHGSLLERAGQNPEESAYHLRNALSPDLQYYRTSLALSLLEKVHPNAKAGYSNLALFELGKIHVKGSLDDEGLPKQHDWLGLVVNRPQAPGAAYYQAQHFADYVLRELNLPGWSFEPFDASVAKQPASKAYEENRTAKVMSGKQMLGLVGEPSQSVRHALKLPSSTSILELDIKKLHSLSRPPSYTPLNRYPSTTQDITLRMPASTAFSQADAFIWAFMDRSAKTSGYNYQIQSIDIFQKSEDKARKQITWRIALSHPERTLTTAESNEMLDGLAAAAKNIIKAERV